MPDMLGGGTPGGIVAVLKQLLLFYPYSSLPATWAQVAQQLNISSTQITQCAARQSSFESVATFGGSWVVVGHNQENTSVANLIKHLTIGLSSLTSCDWEIDKIQFQSLKSSQLFVVNHNCGIMRAQLKAGVAMMAAANCEERKPLVSFIIGFFRADNCPQYTLWVCHKYHKINDQLSGGEQKR